MFSGAVRYISNWYNNRFKTRAAALDFGHCSEAEAARIMFARDLGISVYELRSVDMRGPKAVDLLERRMASLDLELAEVARLDPAAARDLRRGCTLCKSRSRCARDLTRNIPGEVWERYCPNIGTLSALNALH